MELALTTPDGTSIAARLFPAATPRGAVIVVPAMGVTQGFYAAFAEWLAAEGFTTLTFDYRGVGASKRGSLRDVHADIITWAREDAQSALATLREHAPDVPLTWIGHSLGAQILPWIDRSAISRVITIAAGSGYWRENSPPTKRKVWLLWWFIAPTVTPLVGYFPGRRLGMVGDLPRNVIRQWRRWCMHPDYALSDGEATRALFAGVTTPITSISFTDDEMMSKASTSSLLGFYSNAPRSLLRWSPADVGLPRIGHFGFFRTSAREVWSARLRPLLS